MHREKNPTTNPKPLRLSVYRSWGKQRCTGKKISGQILSFAFHCFVLVIQVSFRYLERHSEIFCFFSKERQGEGRRMLEYMGRTGVKLWELAGGSRIEQVFDRKERDTGRYWRGLGIGEEEIDMQSFLSTWSCNCLNLQLKCLAGKLGLDIPSLLHVDKQELGEKEELDNCPVNISWVLQ